MNPIKRRMIIEFVREHAGSIEEIDDRLRCLGLCEHLNSEELQVVRSELQAIDEAEALIAQLRFNNGRWD